MESQSKQITDKSSNDAWGSSDPVQRLKTFHEFAKSDACDPDLIIGAALNDNDDALRCAAISYLSDVSTLKKLMNLDGVIQDAAFLQYHKLLAGCSNSELSVDERVMEIQKLNLKSTKQVALLAKCKSAGSAAVALLDDNTDLSDLCLFAASVHVRKSAAQKISDADLINELIVKTDGKDKTVFKVLTSKVSSAITEKETQPESQSQTNGDIGTKQLLNEPVKESAKESAEKSAENPTKNLTKNPSALEQLLMSLHQPITDDEIAQLRQAAAELQGDTDFDSSPEKINKSPESIEALQLLQSIDQCKRHKGEIGQISTALQSMNCKNTHALVKVKTHYSKLKNKISWPATLPASVEFQSFLELEVALKKLQDENHQHQSELEAAADTLITDIGVALDTGKTAEAEQLWNKIQGVINNTSGSIRTSLQNKTSQYKAKFAELKDWKNFAATEKKKELITQIEHLSETKMHASDKSKLINKLHLEWKTLGYTSANEKLWKQFKTASDIAYEPCKEYFKHKKTVMLQNYKKRIEICEQLETYVESLNEETLNIGVVNKVEAKARDDWKLYAPVEHSKIKKLQKRFYGVMDKLKLIKKTIFLENSNLKKDLISKAKALVELEDNHDAMNQAKSLQAQWKQIGPSSFRDDRKLWESFRASCDKIFEKRDIAKKQAQSEASNAVKSVNNILAQLEALLASSEDEFRDSRKSFSSLQREFYDALVPSIKKERNQLRSRCETISAKIERRYKKLPDKKTLKTRSALLAKAEYCNELESAIELCQDDESFSQLVATIDRDKWERFDRCGNEIFDQAIEKRFEAIANTTSLSQYHALLEKTAQKVSNKVVELEIKAKLDSPESDKGLRMQIQLDQLKNKFNQNADQIDDRQYATDMELGFICAGPLDTKLREELKKRVTAAVEKLV